MIKPIITTKDAFWQEGSLVEGPADTQLLISDETQQSFRGFGGCFNEIGGAVLQKLSTEKARGVVPSIWRRGLWLYNGTAAYWCKRLCAFVVQL